MKPSKRTEKKKRICQIRLVKKLSNHVKKLSENFQGLSNYLNTEVPTFQEGEPGNCCKTIKTYLSVIKQVQKDVKSVTAKSSEFLQQVSELSLKSVPVIDLINDLPEVKFKVDASSVESSKRCLSSEEQIPAKKIKREILENFEDDEDQEEEELEDEYLLEDLSSLDYSTEWDEENDFEDDEDGYYSSDFSDGEDHEETLTIIGKIVESLAEENKSAIDIFSEDNDKDKLTDVACCAAEFVYEVKSNAKIIIITSQCQIEHWFNKLTARKEKMSDDCSKMFLYILKNKYTADFEDWKRVGGALFVEFDLFKQIYDHKTTDFEESNYRDAIFDEIYDFIILDLVCPVDEWQSFFLKNIISIMTSAQKLILQSKKPAIDEN